MPKYNLEFKIDLVKKYNSGKYKGIKVISKAFNIPKGTLEIWVSKYNNYGVDSLKKKLKNKKYDVNFKLFVIQYRKVNQLSLSEIAKKFNLANFAMILS